MYIGDFALGSTLDLKFTTRRFSTGAPHTLAGSPAVACYVGNSTTEITAGITLSVDFDSRTGLNNARVVATSGNGYAAGTDVYVVITAGTVDSVSVVGEVVGSFSIDNRSGLRPSTAGRTLAVSAAGAADANVTQFGGTNLTATGGRPEVNTSHIAGSAVSTSSAQLGVNVVNFGGSAGTFSGGRPEVNTSHAAGTAWNSGAIGANTLAADTITAAKIATDAITAGKIAADAIGASELAADAASEIATSVRTELATELGRVDAAVSTRATPAQVNTEVLDVVNVDTWAIPSAGALTTTPTLALILRYVWTMLRNKKTNDGSWTTVYADDGTTELFKFATSGGATVTQDKAQAP